jgi:hypothetical protein
MSQATDASSVAVPADTDAAAVIQHLLGNSSEPLTVPKIRAQMPAALRAVQIEEVLRRQTSAGVLHVYPKYRSQHERYWDRPMPVHVAALIREALQTGPLPPAELRRKLPAYAHAQIEPVLHEEIARGQLHRHPRLTGRGSERVGLTTPDPKEYLKPELSAVFARLEPLGFRQERLRAAALELLHDEEWSPAPPAPRERAAAEQSQPSPQHS